MALASLCVAQPTAAHEIAAEAGTAEDAAFDIVQARVTAEALWLTFQMRVSGDMGASIPTPVGELAGAPVYAYVWPTDLNSSVVGFEPDQGILALAVTSHPDFDDTPLFDEDGDGNPDNDGHVWHTHWVVLTPDEENCPGGLKVRDIPDGETPQVPLTWPGMPLLIDSPGYSPLVIEDTLSVRVPFRDAPDLKGVAFDAVTAGLRVNRNLDAPLLCVENVFDVASGDLSLPGRVE
ncbi:MAG: hypothetical protein EA406_01125 [Rhodospirillales bacterium]|nr:MAG: hypothetical protein EA406_01125 [Rhodospirillales bacterium]